MQIIRSVFTFAFILVVTSSCNETNKPPDVLAKTFKRSNPALAYSTKDSLDDLSIKKYKISIVEAQNINGFNSRISYRNTLSLLKEIMDKAADNMWTYYVIADQCSLIKEQNRGGLLGVTITFNSISYVPENTKVVIEDSLNNVLFQDVITEDYARITRSKKRLSVTKGINVNKVIRPPFFVRISDSSGSNKVKYFVTAIRR